MEIAYTTNRRERGERMKKKGANRKRSCMVKGINERWKISIYLFISLYARVSVYIWYRCILFARTHTENESTIKWRNCSTKTSTNRSSAFQHRFLSSFCFYFVCLGGFFVSATLYLSFSPSILLLLLQFLRLEMIAATHIIYSGIFR